jgi:hypothetical protein
VTVTLDQYLDPPRREPLGNNIYVFVHISHNSTARQPPKDRLLALVNVMLRLQARHSYAHLGWTYRYLLCDGVVKSKGELAELLKLAKHEGLIHEGPINGAWVADGERG